MNNVTDNTIPRNSDELINCYSDMIAESCPATAEHFENSVHGMTDADCIRTTAQNFLLEVGVAAD